MARKLNTDMAKQERAASANSRDTNTQREKRREKGRWYLKNYDAMKAVASMKNPWADNNHCNNDELYNCHLPDHPCMLIVPGIVGNRDSEERDCGKARLFWGGADSFVRILVLLCSLGRFANTPSPKSWPILVSSRSSDEEDLADIEKATHSGVAEPVAPPSSSLCLAMAQDWGEFASRR
ncbi:hypothetical protein I350_05941 [Cryptococcus amylolentus CBS 6273]|uniref:Uncharacterized protein n=1 Tax=Cryptococcus amylolentus CBS 6273 TaxID=1296118 RepID=A0A1E3JR11_9TREE|nr:hypothetical protein I350_05941 [Cryptococcus amylolentus CBS 6273]